MPSVKRNIFAFIVAITLLIPTFAPNVGFAAGCECFCGNEGDGALDSGVQASSEDCSKACTAITWKMVGCYADESDYPVHSAKCWRKKECTDHYQTVYGKKIGSYWGTTMPYDCSPTKTTAEEMHYCYANDTAIALNVPIGTITEVQSFASYIGIIYEWLLPAGALIAVVMMMIGGLQYVMSRGKEKYISKGKERITNAITGIVLLLSVFVLLNLIDPRLTILNSLKVPIIKTLTMLNVGDSCENLHDFAKIGIDPYPGTCGHKGTVNNIDNVSDQVVSSWKVNQECSFSKCDNGGTCDSSGKCLLCLTTLNPSDSTCQEAESSVSQPVNGGETFYYCRYNSTTAACEAAGSVVSSTTKNAGFTCENFITAAAALSASDVRNNFISGTPNSHLANVSCTFYNSSITYEPSAVDDSGNGIRKVVCEADPCGMSAYAGKTCVYEKNTGTGAYQCE